MEKGLGSATDLAVFEDKPILENSGKASPGGSGGIIEAWLGGRNPRTLAAYRKDMEDFGRFMGLRSGGEAVELLLGLSQGEANGRVLAYRNAMQGRGLSGSTVGRRLASLRSLVKLARMLGRVSWSLDIASPKSERLRDTSGPGLGGWRLMLEEARKRALGGDPLGLRDLALVRLLHDLGLRRGEAASLRVKDYDSETGRLDVLGKGRSQTEPLTVPGPAKRDLEAWLELRGKESGPLFVRLDPATGGRLEGLSGEAIRRIVLRLGRAAGLKKVVRPHGLRHQAITQVLDRNGGDIRAAARFSRHRDINTLARYDDNRQDLGGEMAKLISED